MHAVAHGHVCITVGVDAGETPALPGHGTMGSAATSRGVAQAAENGMYATAAVSAMLLALGVHRLFGGGRSTANPGQGAQSQVTWERSRRAFDAANYGLKYYDPAVDPKLWEQLVEAARLAGQLHNAPSVRLDVEYAGLLYLDQQGNVVSTTGVLGPPCVPGADSCNAAPMRVIRGVLPPDVTSDRITSAHFCLRREAECGFYLQGMHRATGTAGGLC